jgi:2-polyprenyl-3-methyl-5-hydroxy-6-metoxy-1,4-benzoquinol methylase
MKSDTYRYVNDDVRDVLSVLFNGCDGYHRAHKARLARTISILYEMDIKGTLLEVGTSGLIPIAMSVLTPDLEIEVTHFDTSRSEVGELEVEFAGRKRKVRAYCIDLEHDQLNVDSSYFDAVLCAEVLEHMEIDPMHLICEINRITKHQGHLLLTTPNVLSARGLTKIFNGIEPYFYMQYHKSREYHRHNYEYTISSLKTILSAGGFDGTCWTEDLFEDAPNNDIVERLKNIGCNVNNIGDNILARCRKISGVVERWPSGLYV